jgi:hypothetical protein
MESKINEERFQEWAIIELFGHQKVAGLCSEQSIAGSNMLRVDIPGINGKAPFTRFFGGSAIYSITPTDENTVMTALSHICVRPVDIWVVPEKIITNSCSLPSGISLGNFDE